MLVCFLFTHWAPVQTMLVIKSLALWLLCTMLLHPPSRTLICCHSNLDIEFLFMFKTTSLRTWSGESVMFLILPWKPWQILQSLSTADFFLTLSWGSSSSVKGTLRTAALEWHLQRRAFAQTPTYLYAHRFHRGYSAPLSREYKFT